MTTAEQQQLDLPLASPAPTPAFGTWNHRFVLWARSRGQQPDAFGRDADGDITRIEHEGGTMPWTVVFSFWIHDRWEEWATELGFTRGTHRHEEAMRSGHTAAEFDAWLERHVALACPACAPILTTTPTGETR